MSDSDEVVKVVRLGFVGFDTPRLEEAAQHYRNVLGLPLSEQTNDAVYLACGLDHHALSLHRAGHSGLRHFGLQIAGDLDSAVPLLRKAGLSPEVHTTALPGIPRSITVRDPDGFLLFLYTNSTQPLNPYPVTNIAPVKLGHLALFVENAKRSHDFYSNTFGFRWSDWLEDGFVFMRCGPDHHTVNFMNNPKKHGLFHLAWELRDAGHLVKSTDILAIHNVPLVWGPGRHGAGHNLYTYHRDPDGNLIEFFSELDKMSHEELGYFDPRPWHRMRPQRPRRWTFSEGDIWGTHVPPGFLE